MVINLGNPRHLLGFIESDANLTLAGEFRSSGLIGGAEHLCFPNPKCGAQTGHDPCLLPAGTVVRGNGRFYEAVGHTTCGFHLRPLDHDGKGRWPCISERAVNRTFHTVSAFDPVTRDLRPVTVEEFMRALQAATATL